MTTNPMSILIGQPVVVDEHYLGFITGLDPDSDAAHIRAIGDCYPPVTRPLGAGVRRIPLTPELEAARAHTQGQFSIALRGSGQTRYVLVGMAQEDNATLIEMLERLLHAGPEFADDVPAALDFLRGEGTLTSGDYLPLPGVRPPKEDA